MRHVWTMIAAVVIAPLAWLLFAYGQDRSLQAFANQESNGGFHTGDFVRPVLCLAAAGLLVGLIATLRFSPLGAVLTGIAYTASYVALLVSPKAVLDLIPHNVSVMGRHADPTTPLRTGSALLVGALLLVGIASIGRWRRWPEPELGIPDRAGETDSTVVADGRPLGADGLGLSSPARDAEPASVGAHAQHGWTGDSGVRSSDWATTGRR